MQSEGPQVPQAFSWSGMTLCPLPTSFPISLTEHSRICPLCSNFCSTLSSLTFCIWNFFTSLRNEGHPFGTPLTSLPVLLQLHFSPSVTSHVSPEALSPPLPKVYLSTGTPAASPSHFTRGLTPPVIVISSCIFNLSLPTDTFYLACKTCWVSLLSLKMKTLCHLISFAPC